LLIVDDDLFVREALADFLAGADDIEVVGSCPDGEAAVDAARAVPLDVVLMDVRMPGMGGLEAARAILRLQPATRVLAITSFDDDLTIARFFDLGGAGYLLKDTRPAALVDAVRAAHSGLTVVPPAMIRRWGAAHGERPVPQLSERELLVLQGLREGLTISEIADRLFLSPTTIKAALGDLRDKLGAPTRGHLLARALELGLLP
jgi:DNA-binding NarL/FixJ family response regulator